MRDDTFTDEESPSMEPPLAEAHGNSDSVWRYVKFFIYVPWPIAVPDGYFQVVERRSNPGCGEQSAEWLLDVMPEQIANAIAAGSDSTFVILQFHRRPYVDTRWVQYLFEVMHTAESWQLLYQFRGHLPDGVSLPPPHEATPLETFGTVIEATTCLVSGSEIRKDHGLNEAFDRCIRECESFLEAYVQATEDFRIGFINRSTVLAMVPAVLIDPVNHRTESTGLRVNDEGAYPAEPPTEVTLEQTAEIARRSKLSELGEPSIAILHWRRLAFRALHVDGDYAAAVVFAHTAGEVFFDALLLRVAWEEISTFRGTVLTREQVAEWFSARTPLSDRLRNRYHVRLNGGWDADRPGNPICEWERKVARLRNRVVHAGYCPNNLEAEDAFDALVTMENYVFDLLIHDRNRTRYPLTVYMMLGEDGLEQRGLFGGKLRLAILAAPANWRASFYDFRRWVVEHAVV